MSGTVAAQIITFALSFVLARIYDPGDFGRYAIFVGCAGVLAAASTGAFDRVILLAGSSEEARKAATLTLAASGVCAFLFMVMGILITSSGGRIALPLPAIDVIAFIPAFVIFYSAAQVFVYSSLREDRVRSLALFKVLQSAAMGLIQAAMASLALFSGLILGNVAGWLLLGSAGIYWRLKRGQLREDLAIGSLALVAKQNWRYPRYIMPNEVLDNLSNQIPLMLIGSFISLSTAGHYSIAIMMLSAPAAVVGQAVGQSFLQYLANHSDEKQAIRRAMYQIWLGMAAVGFIPFAVVLAFGPQIFGFAFGANWTEAGIVAQALSVLLFVRFVSSPTSTIYLKLGLQKEQWWFCVAAACYRTAAYSLVAFDFDLLSIIYIHVICEAIAIVMYNLLALHRLYDANSRVAAG